MTSDEIPFRSRGEVESQAAMLIETAGRSYRADELAPDAFYYAEQLGLTVRWTRFHLPEIAGKLERGPGGTVIELNEADPFQRQNFTLAHEIGHHQLHPLRSWTDTNRTMYRRASWRGDSAERRAEYQANLFAAALLMPEPVIRGSWDLLHSPNYLAGRFRVSKEAMKRRLEALGLIAISPPGFIYADLSKIEHRMPRPEQTESLSRPPARLNPIRLDEQGRIIPMSAAERAARQASFNRALREAAASTDDDNPPGSP